MTAIKPRYILCWHCNRKLHGRHHANVETESGVVVTHVQCKREMEREGIVVVGGPP